MPIGGLASGELGGVGGTTSGGGGGAVNSVNAGDASVVISPTTGTVIVETGTLDQIANLHTAVANWTNGGFKITNIANGTASTDAAAFGQIPTILPPYTTVAVSATGNSAASTFELVTTSTSTITRTLPAPANNMIMGFKKIDAAVGTLIISHHAAETIDGANTFTINAQWQAVEFISNGTNWFIK